MLKSVANKIKKRNSTEKKKREKKESRLNECRSSTWSEQEVSLWLEDIGLPQYQQLFVENAIDGYELLFLTKTDLIEMEIEANNIRTIIKHLENLKRNEEDQKIQQILIAQKYTCGKSISAHY